MIGRAIGFLVLCFLVGLFLACLGITPQGILTDTWQTILRVFWTVADFARWSVPYILLGAVIVVPLSPLALFQRLGRRRR